MLKINNRSLLSFSSTIIFILATNQSFANKNFTRSQPPETLPTTASPLNMSLYNAVTIGAYINNSGATVPLAYSNKGTQWILSSALPLPPDVIEQSNKQDTFLNGVACDIGSRHCAAVGTYATNARTTNPLAYAPLSYFSTDGGTNWQLSTTLPLPADVVIPASSQASALYSVTCSKLTQRRCTSVGYYINDQGASAPLSYTTSNRGNDWTLSTTLPLPADVITNAKQQKSKLFGVACDAQNKVCNAVGSYINTDGSTVPLIYGSTNQGETWTINQDPFPVPEDAATKNQYSQLSAISCNGLGTLCNATGYYKTNTGSTAPLSYISFDGGLTWYLSAQIPLPSDVITQAALQTTYLNGVFCDKFFGLRCSAVGFYTNTKGTIAPLSYTSTDGGANWTVASAPLPLPANAATGIFANIGLFSVVCDGLKILCTAVGYYNTNDNTGLAPLSYVSINGGNTWTVRPEVQLPEGADPTKKQAARFNSVN